MLVGATTENPSFELNAALLSRCRVVVLEPLAGADLVALLERALADADAAWLRSPGVAAEPEALAAIAGLASGDARKALTLLELAVEDAARRAAPSVDGRTTSPPWRSARSCSTTRRGEEHFNLISALHKSLRESDPDAALYWLGAHARGRRGSALRGAPDAALRRRGRRARRPARARARRSPPGRPTSGSARPRANWRSPQVAVYLALAPKSVAVYRAWGEVRATIARRPADPVPMSIRNAPTALMKDVGYGAGYVYAPDTGSGVGGLDCLPDSLAGTRFYEPGGAGVEARIAERLAELARRRAEARERDGKRKP